MSLIWSPHVIADADTISSLVAGDRVAVQRLFLAESRRIHNAFLTLGDPRIAYAYGRGYSQLAAHTAGSHMAVAIFEAQLAELILAAGTAPIELDAHLNTAEMHASRALSSRGVRARTMSKITLLRIVAQKARGEMDAAFQQFDDVRRELWWSTSVNPDDMVLLARQEVMMRGNLNEHMQLLQQSSRYRATRPLEYFTTLKRVFEFFTNTGLADSVRTLQPRLVAAYGETRPNLSPLSRVSLLKNLAQSSGLLGDLDRAKSYAQVATDDAESLGLAGQVRQLKEISAGLDAGTVVGTLTTFRVPRA